MLWRRGARPIAAGMLVLSISACGSSKPNATSTASTTTQSVSPATGSDVGAAFRQRAAALCMTATNKLLAQGPFPYPDFDPEHPDAAELPGIATYEAKTVATEQSWQAQLVALGRPASGGAGWTVFLNAVDRDVTATVAQQKAAAQGDGAAFTTTFHDLTSSGLTDTQVALAIALPSCDPGKLGDPSASNPVPVRKP